jgi:hypothetical protein
LVSRAHGIKAVSCTRQGGALKRSLKITLAGLAVTFVVAAGAGHNDVPTSRPATGWCVQVQIPESIA